MRTRESVDKTFRSSLSESSFTNAAQKVGGAMTKTLKVMGKVGDVAAKTMTSGAAVGRKIYKKYGKEYTPKNSEKKAANYTKRTGKTPSWKRKQSESILSETHGKESWEKLSYLRDDFGLEDSYLVQAFMFWMDEREALEMMDDWAHQHDIQHGPFADPEKGDVY